MKPQGVLLLGVVSLSASLIGCVPAGMVAPFYRIDCPKGWVEADGEHHKIDLRGRTVFGVGPWPQGGGEIRLGDAQGAHKLRLAALENENAPKKGDLSIEGVRLEYQDEAKAEARAAEDTQMWRAGHWTDHFPPNVGLLYCVKQ
jgi:hypothetical protein